MNVIQIENLWKEYRLGVIGHGTLTQDIQSWWARMSGKEDPNQREETTGRNRALNAACQPGQLLTKRLFSQIAFSPLTAHANG